jgi:uncharacterized protein
MSTALRHVLLKLHSRCNLACGYCYVYEHVDQSWRRQPQVMSAEIIDATAARLAEHCRDRRLSRATVTFHGGEPLLAGVRVIDYAVRSFRAAAPAGVTLGFHIQTNGTLLTEEVLDAFDRHDIRVGVSIDGDQRSHDRQRRYAHGGGSYRTVQAGLELLRDPRYRRLYSGLLCTVDLDNDPLDVYAGLLAFEPPRMDLLLPHGNWTAPPPGRAVASSETPYADWLIPIFDRWYDAPGRPTDIRMFSAIMSLLLGGRSGTETFGLDPVDFVIVETDGSIEQSDALKTTAEGMAATGLHVTRHGFDDVLRLPQLRARQSGLAALGPVCHSCELVEVCGGGHYAHRFDVRTGFRNPTVYCADQQKLIRHIGRRMRADLARPTAEPDRAAPVDVR